MLLPDLPPPTEGLFHTEPNTECFIDARNMGTGVLFVARGRLCWAGVGSPCGFSVEYPHIAVHAECRGISRFPRPHIYVMVDSELFPEDKEEDEDSDDSFHNPDPEDKCTSVRFVPANLDSLPVIYKAISDCQVLHPPEDQDSDNEFPEDDEDEGHYDLEESADPPGPLPRVNYVNQNYENNMENGLGEVVEGGGVHVEDVEEMDQDQFEDV